MLENLFPILLKQKFIIINLMKTIIFLKYKIKKNAKINI